MNKTMYLKSSLLIDGLCDEPIDNALVVIKGNEIGYAGKFDDGPMGLDRDSEIFDLKGMTIMPGLIDTHIHLSLEGRPDYFEPMIMESPTLTAVRAVPRVKRILQSGFTTIRTMGDKGHIDIAIKKAIQMGEIPGPRIIASGNCITATGGHGDMFPDHVKIEGIGRIVDGPIEARKAAREQLKHGADNIKLMATGGGMSPGPGTVPQLTIEEMGAAVEEAEKYERITAAHAIGAVGIKNALLAGVRTIEHGSFLDDKGIELLLEKGAFLVPTLAAFKTLKFGKEGGVSEHTIKKVMHFQTAHTKNLKKAIKAGVKIIVGTDAGTPFNYHGESAYELECLVNQGFSEMNAIKSATSIAAEALKLENIGTVKQGSIADLLVIDGNPLKDIRILQDQQRIHLVMKAGRLIPKSGD